MREIKFKAFVKDKQKMYNDVIFVSFKFPKKFVSRTKIVIEEKDGEVIPLQYTGLRDKNGKEIYEGDIIKHFAGELGVVKFKNGCFGVEWLNGDFLICIPFEYHSVIGNIYENPELLEVENGI